MSNLDQFESVFKAADKPVFHHQSIELQRVLIVTDGDAESCLLFQRRAERVLRALLRLSEPMWTLFQSSDFASVQELIERIEHLRPSLILTYRNLKIAAHEHPYSLGVFVDVMTQATAIPVMLFPREIVNPDVDGNWDDSNSVMAVTDHMAGEDRLVSYAAQLTEPHGKLFLMHVEDQSTYERYMHTIEKIPSIDTETAREEILDQLLKDPMDYIHSCAKVLKDHALPLEVVPHVTIGHFLADYRRLIDQHAVDVLVMNTKDDDQLAMHGLAYPLSVEIRDTPLLLL